MAVPVEGDVNNPSFDLSGVISGAILNVLTKAITAPFTLLANLVGSEEDLQRISFSTGSATLGDKSKAKLTELGTALSERPNLELVITGRLNLSADRERLQRNQLKDVLLERGLSEEDIKARGPEWEGEIAKLYTGLPASGDASDTLTPSEQYNHIVVNITIADEKMIALASQRASEVKRFLVSEAGLAPERAVVAQANLKESDNEFSGVELGIGD